MSSGLYLVIFGLLLMVIFGPKKLKLYSAVIFVLLLFVYFSPIFKERDSAKISYDSSGNMIVQEGDVQIVIPRNGAINPKQ